MTSSLPSRPAILVLTPEELVSLHTALGDLAMLGLDVRTDARIDQRMTALHRSLAPILQVLEPLRHKITQLRQAPTPEPGIPALVVECRQLGHLAEGHPEALPDAALSFSASLLEQLTSIMSPEARAAWGIVFAELLQPTAATQAAGDEGERPLSARQEGSTAEELEALTQDAVAWVRDQGRGADEAQIRASLMEVVGLPLWPQIRAALPASPVELLRALRRAVEKVAGPEDLSPAEQIREELAGAGAIQCPACGAIGHHTPDCPTVTRRPLDGGMRLRDLAPGVGLAPEHLRPCPQHPINRERWGHMRCDCGLAPEQSELQQPTAATQAEQPHAAQETVEQTPSPAEQIREELAGARAIQCPCGAIGHHAPDCPIVTRRPEVQGLGLQVEQIERIRQVLRGGGELDADDVRALQNVGEILIDYAASLRGEDPLPSDAIGRVAGLANDWNRQARELEAAAEDRSRHTPERRQMQAKALVYRTCAHAVTRVLVGERPKAADEEQRRKRERLAMLPNPIRRVIICRPSGTWPELTAACEAAGIPWAYQGQAGDGTEHDAGPARAGDVWLGCWPGQDKGVGAEAEAARETVRQAGGVLWGLCEPRPSELLARLRAQREVPAPQMRAARDALVGRPEAGGAAAVTTCDACDEVITPESAVRVRGGNAVYCAGCAPADFTPPEGDLVMGDLVIGARTAGPKSPKEGA